MPRATHRDLVPAVLRQFRVLLRAMGAHYRRVESGAGLGGAQLGALAEIAAPAGIMMGELAERLGIELSTASNLATRLEELGLVVRYRAPDDRRIVRLAITAAGRRRLGKASPPSGGLLEQALLGMTAAQLGALQRQLGAVLKRMGRGGEHETKKRGQRPRSGYPQSISSSSAAGTGKPGRHRG